MIQQLLYIAIITTAVSCKCPCPKNHKETEHHIKEYGVNCCDNIVDRNVKSLITTDLLNVVRTK